MKRLILGLSISMIGVVGLAEQAQSDAVFYEAIPFQKVLQQGDYQYYVGSQIMTGELIYSRSDAHGYRFEFKTSEQDIDKLPILKAHSKDAPTTQFVLNNHSDMNAQETARAAVYLGIKTDLNNPQFIQNKCVISGPITLQATTIGYYGPDQAETFTDIKAVRIIKTGPFTEVCSAS